MRKNFWQHRNSCDFNKKFSRFDMLFESVMAGIPIYQDIKNDPTLFIRKPNLHLICEDVCKEHYIVSESTGDAILLEECLFWTERQLIAEGILDKVFSAVQGIYEKIKEGIAAIVTESSDAIKEFCDKIMNSKIVQAIRKKLGLDEKFGNLKKFIKITDANGEEVNNVSESRLNIIRRQLVLEATTLSKAEQAITDPTEVQKFIDKYENYLNGKSELKNKKGEPLDKKYAQRRLKLFREKLNSLNSTDSVEEPKASKNAKAASSKEADSDSGQADVKAVSSKEEKPKSTKPVGKIVIDEGISNVARKVGEEATSDESVTTASKTAAVAEGGNEAEKELSDEAPKEEKKGGLFNKAVNWAKDKIKAGVTAVKDWYAKQNKWVKYLIWGIIAIMALSAVWLLITSFVMPIITVIIHGSLMQAASAVFTVVMAGKTYHSTFKAGQTAWKTGEGWRKILHATRRCNSCYNRFE